jgi:helicase required for RNAi-mediated heterochromatin assembly 1
LIRTKVRSKYKSIWIRGALNNAAFRNDIVLLSLVRSNRRGNIGFLDSENRACVALSRARRGFYLFGNAELLACETRVWAAVAKIMWGKDVPKIKTGQPRRIGFHFPLVCSKHGNKSWIETAEDWDSITGGCLFPCKGELPCGHKCPYTCHP